MVPSSQKKILFAQIEAQKVKWLIRGRTRWSRDHTQPAWLGPCSRPTVLPATEGILLPSVRGACGRVSSWEERISCYPLEVSFPAFNENPPRSGHTLCLSAEGVLFGLWSVPSLWERANTEGEGCSVEYHSAGCGFLMNIQSLRLSHGAARSAWSPCLLLMTLGGGWSISHLGRLYWCLLPHKPMCRRWCRTTQGQCDGEQEESGSHAHIRVSNISIAFSHVKYLLS